MGTITDNQDAHPVCKAVRDVRIERGLTQVDVAKALELLQPYVSAWERFRVPTVDQIRDLENVFKVAPGTILRRAGYVVALDSMQLEHHIKLDRDLSRESKRALIEFLNYRRALDGAGSPSVEEAAPTARRTRRARSQR